MPLRRLLLHVAILEFLPAAARARVIAPHAFAAVADRLDGFVGGRRSRGTARTRWIAVAAGGRRFIGRRRVVCRGGDSPQRAHEPRAFALEPEERTGDLLGNSSPHSFEGLHPLALVFDLGVLLR